MAIPVLIMGRSGSGKTYSLRNFTQDEVGIISVEKGRLPFKSNLRVARVPAFNSEEAQQLSRAQVNAAKYSWIKTAIKSSKVNAIVIDDSQYLLVNELFDRSKEKGYDKYVDMASNFRDLVHSINDLEDENKIVYFLHHSENDDNGREKAKTIGKMIDEKLVLEGCFDIVIYCENQKFYTQANGMSTAKTPEGMFPEVEIPNDLKIVDDAIREYWGLQKTAKKGGKA